MQGIADACRALNTPVTGGNVSLYNQYVEEGRTVAIHPTPTIGMVGVLPDVTVRATMDLKPGAHTLYLLGTHADSVGASQYLETVHGLEAGRVPALDLGLEQRVIDGTLALIRAGLTTTAHDCAEGGLAVALAEMAIAGGRGLKVSLNAPADVRADALLFGEAHSRVVVAVPVGREGEAEARLGELNVPFALLGDAPGQAGAGELQAVTIALPAHNVHLSVNLETLRTAFESPLTEILG